MAGDTSSNIFINVDTSQAMAQLRALEKELTALNRSLIVGTKTASQAQAKYAQSLLHNVNATGQWTASMTRMSTASEQFANRLDRQKLSLKEYFRYGMASTKTFGRAFGGEFDTLGKLVDKRVKTLQQQYVQLGRDAQGAMNAMKFNPKSLNYGNVTTQLMAATQRQQIFNKLVDDGSTKLLNFGKNTQWAGRQLMVGFTIPLMLFGSQAIKTFKEIETQVIRFKKVYGDIFTDQGATDVALKNIRKLGDEYTKYGLKVSDTIKTAADAAAAGFSGKGLENLVEQTNKLAVLGGVTQEKALETTIALKNAFQIDTGKMAGTIDFLNAVENQTVVALDDLTEAIPKVAPVIQQLGGDVKDLAYFMAAMQEGGISAAQGANALKSGLASLINPSNAASKAAASVGISIKGIVEANAGNLRNTVTSFAKALQPLTDLERSRVIEKVFGKYQFARISALLNNIGREGTQAARVLQLTNASVEELAILSQRELKIQADSPMNKFVGSVEKLKAAIAPVGELFAKVLTPVIEFITRMAEKFNGLPDGIKKAIGVITIVVGGLGPLFLMTFGLLANAVANSVKGLQVLRKGYQQLSAGSSDAALKTQYLTQEELENISISNALYSKHQQLSAAYQLEAAALTSLTSVYKGAGVAMGGFAAQNPGMFMPGFKGKPKMFAGGTTSVPGPRGAGDIVPAMLSPGESVIPAKQTQKYSGFISQIIGDKVPGFAGGLFPAFGAAAKIGSGVGSRGTIGAMAPVIPLRGVPIAQELSGIRYSVEGSRVRVTVGDESFFIPAKKLDNFKTKLKENESWMVQNKRTDSTEEELIRTIKRKGYSGQEVSPSTIYSRLPKFRTARNSQQNQDVADKRFKLLVKSQNPNLIKLQNYLQNEEKVYLERALGPEIFGSLKGFNVNKLTPSHIREVRSQNRSVEDWAPSKIARDWSWFNSAIRGTRFGKIRGGHPLNAPQAREVLDNLKLTPFEQLTNEKKALQTALEYRLNRKPSYYDDFIFTDNAMMKVKPMKLANGIVSVPGPKGAGDIQPAMLSPGEAVIPAKQSAKYSSLVSAMIQDRVPGFMAGTPGMLAGVKSTAIGTKFVGMPRSFAKTQSARLAEERLEAEFAKSSMRDVPPTNFGHQVEGFTGRSFPIQGVGGVYRKPNGDVVVVKPMVDEATAQAEINANIISRRLKSNAPEQTMRTMLDPTDPMGKRKIIVVESPYKKSFAKTTGKFTKQQYISQLWQSALRGDKDLSMSNVSGNNVIDQGTSFIYGKASGFREPTKNIPEVEEMALINVLGVKGGAKKAFAEATSDIARSMSRNEFIQEFKSFTNNSLPILRNTIDSFKLNPAQKELYEAVYSRAERAKTADWGKIYDAHVKVDSVKKYATGVVSVPGPKGAGDVVPAMLSPGEAVIPAEQSAKYMPLIRSMIADDVPGFAKSNIPTRGSGSRGSKYTYQSAVDRGSNYRATQGFPVLQPSPMAPVTNAISQSSIQMAAGLKLAGQNISGGMQNLAQSAVTTSNKTKEGLKSAGSNVSTSVTKFGKRVSDGVKSIGPSIRSSTAALDLATKSQRANLGMAVSNARMQMMPMDKTQGIRGFIGGYGNVSQTVTDENGIKRTATAEERTNMRQQNRMNFSQKMMPAQMAGMMAPMVAQAYATKNPDSSIAKNMDAIMMLSMLTMLLPMLNSPLKMLAATAIGLVAVFKMQAATIKKNVIEGQKQAEAMTMTTARLEELGKITGKVSITQTAAAQRKSRTMEIVPVSMEFGNNIISNSDFGKNLKKTFEESMSIFGEGTAVDSLVNQLGTAVSQGVLDAGQAESIAVALTRNLKDSRLELNVRGRLIQLLGPNGENLTTDPLKVQLELIASGQKMQDAAVANLNKVAKEQVGINTGAEVAQLGAGAVGGAFLGARAGGQAARMLSTVSNAGSIAASEIKIAKAVEGVTKIGKALAIARSVRVGAQVGSLATGATGVGAIPGAVGFALSTAIFGGIEIAIRSWQKGKEKAAIGKAAGMVQGLVSQNLAATQASADVLTAQYDSAIANLELKKKTLKTEKERTAVDQQIADLQTKKDSGLKTLRVQAGNTLESVSTSYDQVSKRSLMETLSPLGSGRGQVRDKYMEAFQVGMQDKFKDNPALKAQAMALQGQLDSIGNDKVTLEISTLVTSDTLTPGEASTLVNTLTKTGMDITKTLKTIVSVQGTEGLQRLSTLLTLIPNENNQKQLLFAIKGMDKGEADATLTAIEQLAIIPDYIGIDINIETQKNDIADLKARGKEIDALKKKFPKGEVSLKALVKMQEEAGGVGKNLTLDAALAQWGAISKLPKDLQLQATISIGSINESDSFDKIIDRELTTMYSKKFPNARGRLAAESLNAFKKDADNITEAQKAYFEKVAPQLFGNANVDDSKSGTGKNKDGTTGTRDMSFLDELGQRLKLVKEGGFDALNPLKAIREFYSKGGTKTINPMLKDQRGAIKEIEQAAKSAGVTLNTDFMDVIRGLDANQFKLWSNTLFKVAKNGRITGLAEDFKLINEAFATGTIGSYIDDLKTASREIENQVKAQDILTKAGYNALEIQKILENKTLVATIAQKGMLAASTEERKELNAEIQKTINLNQKLAEIKLGNNIDDLNAQSEAYKKLNAAGVKQEVINEILKDKSNAWAISNAPGNVAEQYLPLIKKTKNYLDLLKLIEEQTKTFEQKTQDAIDSNTAALELQARTLQNAFDIKNIGLKADIVIAEDAVAKANDKIQVEQDKIDVINIELKYDPKIGQNFLDDLQERISDAQKNIDLTFDRPLQALSDRSNVLSNDLTLIDKAAESINTKYDKQQEALTKISQLNQDIAAQEKSRISLADALSQGDISAAAQQAQEMRAQAAEIANRNSGDFLAAGRKSEIDNLRSASGMTRVQIEAEQFAIGQKTYALEQARKVAQAAILVIEDQIYNITELREAKLLDIRNIETAIDVIRNKELKDAEKILEGKQKELEANQKILDAQLLNIENQKLAWESVQLKLDDYKAKLKEINDGPLASMLSTIQSIATALANIKSPTYSAGSAFVGNGSGDNDAAAIAAKATADKAAADKATAEAAATKAAADAIKNNPNVPSILASQESGAIGAASIAARQAAAAKAAADKSNQAAAALRKLTSGQTLSAQERTLLGMSTGGMVPKYFASGGMARGTDTVPAMLTPGEFIVNRQATSKFRPLLERLNSPTYSTGSLGSVAPANVSSSSSVNNNLSSVYNYSVGITVNGSNANADDIARVVMTQIKNVDSQRIRGQRA